jgi:hypothetical protein
MLREIVAGEVIRGEHLDRAPLGGDSADSQLDSMTIWSDIWNFHCDGYHARICR